MLFPDKYIISAIRVSLDIELQEGVSMDQLKNIIARVINPLIINNFNKLISILYRMDINEAKLRQLLHENPAEDAGTILAELIIERQLQKLKSQKENKSTDIIPEDEKW